MKALLYNLSFPGFKSKLKNWRYFGVKLFGTGWDIKGLFEQIRVSVIDTKVLFIREKTLWDNSLGTRSQLLYQLS